MLHELTTLHPSNNIPARGCRFRRHIKFGLYSSKELSITQGSPFKHERSIIPLPAHCTVMITPRTHLVHPSQSQPLDKPEHKSYILISSMRSVSPGKLSQGKGLCHARHPFHGARVDVYLQPFIAKKPERVRTCHPHASHRSVTATGRAALHRRRMPSASAAHGEPRCWDFLGI
jgi:hypothetical protein